MFFVVTYGNDADKSALYAIDRESGDVLNSWKPKNGFHMPHDVIVARGGADVYVAEIDGQRVWKLTSEKYGL